MKQTPPQTANPDDTRLRTAVPAAVIVILSKEPDPQSNIITLQDYFHDGRHFIPIFRSIESFQQSTHGGVKNPTYRIDRGMFVAMLHGPETVILDPSLPDEMITTGDLLKHTFPKPSGSPGSTPK